MNKGNTMFAFSSKLWYNKRRVSANGEATVYIQVTINRQHDEYDQKLRWPVDKIDIDNFRLLPRWPKDLEVSDYNLIIKCAQAKHTEILLTYRLRKEPIDIKKFAQELRTFDSKECFITFFQNECERRFRKKEIEKKTYQNGKAVLLQVMAYDNLSLFKNINKKWIHGFKLFLENATYGRENKKYKRGTIWDRIKTTLAYLQLATEEPMIYVSEDVFKFSNPKPPEETTFLNRKELHALIDLHDQDLTSVQNRVLDAFLFACFTGLRISDLYDVNSKWEVQDDFLDFIPFKNRKRGKLLRIPLLPIARSFINKKGLKYFDLPNSVQFNETLKQLADYASIRKVLTAHVARHTFGYLYMTTIGNLYGLKELLGHSKIETTQRYAHLDDEYKYETTLGIQKGFGEIVLKIAR
jgi:integrase/recombinase XerD